MPPILRSVVAQCHRCGFGRSSGSRKFSSSPPGSRRTNEPTELRKFVGRFVLRSLLASIGYGVGALTLGNPAAKAEAVRQEEMKEFHRDMDERVKCLME